MGLLSERDPVADIENVAIRRPELSTRTRSTPDEDLVPVQRADQVTVNAEDVRNATVSPEPEALKWNVVPATRVLGMRAAFLAGDVLEAVALE